MTKSIVSKNAKPEPQWYICGSYVLDVLFGVRTAKDIDVCYLGTSRTPTQDEIFAWIAKHGFHRTPLNPQFIRVPQLESPDAGGEPILNIDYWRLENDGKVYAVDPKTKAKTELTAAIAPKLEILAHPVPQERAQKALDRMASIAKLANPSIKQQLEQYAAKASGGKPA